MKGKFKGEKNDWKRDNEILEQKRKGKDKKWCIKLEIWEWDRTGKYEWEGKESMKKSKRDKNEMESV